MELAAEGGCSPINSNITATDNHMQVIETSHLTENDVAIGIFHSGNRAFFIN